MLEFTKETALLEIKVTDEGVGLSRIEIGKLFKPFGTLSKKDSSHKITSHGFGLAVCKQICNALGGSIEAEPNNMKGSVFTFTMKIEMIQVS